MARWMLVLVLLSPLGANAQSPASHHELQFEEFTQAGQVIGCAIGFRVMWTEGGQVLGVAGAAGLYLNYISKRLIPGLKVAGGINAVRQRIQHAWVQTTLYGKTSGFQRVEAENGMDYVGWNYGDDKPAILPMSMASQGFVLGILLEPKSVARTVAVPVAPGAVQDRLKQCLTVHLPDAAPGVAK